MEKPIEKRTAKIKRLLKKAEVLAIFCVLISSSKARAIVFINEVFINPCASADDSEFVELLGTPGMKLDGYAIAILNGTGNELYPLNSIPPDPNPSPEIDEFFSLDGLKLGRNGILLLGANTLIHFPSYFPSYLSDSNFADPNWRNLWNGGLDVPGTIKQNGSTTIVLIRNRPGRTQADPCNPDGLRWGKTIRHDAQLKTPVYDPRDGNDKDQWGNGDLDEGEPNHLGGNTLDMCGTSTPADANDDLEIVDEVSFEDMQGWEYDTDDRHVDANSTVVGLPHRHVHALDDPAGFNPDALSRVDYRTKGVGWTPATGATGEMANGKNWQDTATEQWIRGESTRGATYPYPFFYSIASNSDPNSLQPYETQVPMWLYDGNAPDFNYSTPKTYEIGGGRINQLSVPFIPGDCDRDGVCDANDIAKIAAVFGDYDWIFANSVPGSAETDSGDPATQTRPWDVDATGDNGIESNDLQWALNFQGDTTGQIIGIKYTSNIPASTGVYLNPNTGVQCTITTDVNIPSGHTLAALRVGDIVEITVKGQVTAGPNTTSGKENGIMQFVHDVEINLPGVVKVVSIEPLGSFSKTRASLESPQGTNGDLGVGLINGYTTSFTQGLTAPSALYRVTLEAIGEGSADVVILPATDSMFAASAPRGLKIGHTNSNGDPNSSIYPSAMSIVSILPPGDINGDRIVNFKDFAILVNKWLQAPGSPSADIAPQGGDGIVDMLDLDVLADDWPAGTIM